MRPLDSALKWNHTFLALIYSANRKQNPQPHLLPRDSGCIARMCCSKEGLGVSWQVGQCTHSPHPPCEAASGGVNSCVLANVSITQAGSDLSRIEVVPASSSSRCSCRHKAWHSMGWGWPGKTNPSLETEPPCSESLEILCKCRKCGIFQPSTHLPLQCLCMCVCMEMTYQMQISKPTKKQAEWL